MTRILKRNMTWPFIIIFSIVSAAATALLNLIPALENTSFTAPAETLELWVVLAVYIIMNCKSYKDAMLKTFVFFLISQPLIYLIEVPFTEKGWGLFSYYPFWGIITVLTIPGAAIAYRVKKDDVLSAVILSVANGIMIITGLSRISSVIIDFPRYLISILFTLFFSFFFIFKLLKKKKIRLIAVILAVILIIAGLCMFLFFPQDSSAGYPLEDGQWTVESVSPNGLKVSITENNKLDLQSHTNGFYTVVLISEEGKEICYGITVDGPEHYIKISKDYYLN